GVAGRRLRRVELNTHWTGRHFDAELFHNDSAGFLVGQQAQEACAPRHNMTPTCVDFDNSLVPLTNKALVERAVLEYCRCLSRDIREFDLPMVSVDPATKSNQLLAIVRISWSAEIVLCEAVSSWSMSLRDTGRISTRIRDRIGWRAARIAQITGNR